MGAMFLSLSRVGLSMTSFAQLKNDLGVEYSLTINSPQLIKQLLHEGVIRMLCRISGQKLGLQGRACYDA
eukprot:7643621-Pyramimonas_sp.AAC.1